MLVSELKELVKKYDEKDLRILVSEMYKAMPKKLREAKNIDDLLQDVNAYMIIGKMKNSQGKQIDVNSIKPEIELFIDYAYKQYYFAPNSYIHKKERPKWRFKVKAYIKDLQSVSIDSAEGNTATDLLKKLYEMLCYGCCYYIFNTDNPFRSVGIEQTQLLGTIIARKLGNGINNESAKYVVKLVIDSEVDRETLHSFLIKELISNLKTPDSKGIVIEQCKLLKKEMQSSKPDMSKKSRTTNYYDYKRIDKINNLVETVFRIHAELYEYDEAVSYFNENNIERNAEISLYVLLKFLLEYKKKEYWISEYEKALKKGVEPRETLQKTYNYILDNDEMPKYFVN